MSWTEILIPSLATLKARAGWGDTPTPPTPPSETVTTFNYIIEYGESPQIIWNTRSGESITKAEVTFPRGGLALTHDGNYDPLIMSAIADAINVSGATVDSISFDGIVIDVTYTYNGITTHFTIGTVQEETYTYEVTAENLFIAVPAVRQRNLADDLYITDGGEYSVMFSYTSPADTVGMLGVAEGEEITFNTNDFANYYDITFDPDNGILHMQAVEWYYMIQADVTTVTNT